MNTAAALLLLSVAAAGLMGGGGGGGFVLKSIEDYFWDRLSVCCHKCGQIKCLKLAKEMNIYSVIL